MKSNTKFFKFVKWGPHKSARKDVELQKLHKVLKCFFELSSRLSGLRDILFTAWDNGKWHNSHSSKI